MKLSEEDRRQLEADIPRIVSSLKQMLGLPEDITLEELHKHNEDRREQWIESMELRKLRKLKKAKADLLAMEIANARKEEERRDKLC